MKEHWASALVVFLSAPIVSSSAYRLAQRQVLPHRAALGQHLFQRKRILTEVPTTQTTLEAELLSAAHQL